MLQIEMCILMQSCVPPTLNITVRRYGIVKYVEKFCNSKKDNKSISCRVNSFQNTYFWQRRYVFITTLFYVSIIIRIELHLGNAALQQEEDAQTSFKMFAETCS